jgi:tetrathionate reductase subunit B
MNVKEKKKLSRKEFLKVAGKGAAVLAVAGLVSKVSAKSAKVPKTIAGAKLAMVIDLRRCYGCHACSIACKSEYKVPLGTWRSWVKQVDRGAYPKVRRFFLPRLCNHCEHPPCVGVCPTGASHKREDGAVLIHEDRCIGCRLCIAACPYEARFFHPDKHISNKCTFCIHRVVEKVVPACVNTCPAEARKFGDLNDPKSEVSKLVANNPVQVLKPELGTEPQVFYIGVETSVVEV